MEGTERKKLKPETARRLGAALAGFDSAMNELANIVRISRNGENSEAIVAAADRYFEARRESDIALDEAEAELR